MLLCTGRLIRHDGALCLTVAQADPSLRDRVLWRWFATRQAVALATQQQRPVVALLTVRDAHVVERVWPTTLAVQCPSALLCADVSSSRGFAHSGGG